MTRTINTCAKTLSYYVSLPGHIENLFGSYFENLEKYEQYALLATLAVYLASRQFQEWDNQSLHDIYMERIPGALSGEVEEILPELEQLEQQSSGTLACLIQPLIENILYTGVEEG
jgi:hypothetical protein